MASALRENFGRAHVSRSTVDELRDKSEAWKAAAQRADSDLRDLRTWLRFLVTAALATGFALGLAARELARAFGWWV